ncbi:MAG: hypothetical protein QXH85_04460 [Candidatus Bathyarchaeia archaeon]
MIGLIWIGVLGFCVRRLRLGVLVMSLGVGVLILPLLSRLLELFFLVLVSLLCATARVCGTST